MVVGPTLTVVTSLSFATASTDPSALTVTQRALMLTATGLNGSSASAPVRRSSANARSLWPASSTAYSRLKAGSYASVSFGFQPDWDTATCMGKPGSGVSAPVAASEL